MNWVTLLIVGAVCLIIDYVVPMMPPPLHVVLRVVGWICVAVALILLLVALLGGGVLP